MFCGHCGALVQAGQVFCSNCGQALTGAVAHPPAASPPSAPSAAPPPSLTAQTSPMSSSTAVAKPSRVAQDIRVLGILWIIYSALRLIPGMAMLVLGRAHFPFLLAPFPVRLHGLAGPLLSMLGLTFSGLAIAGIIAGLGLMSYNSWARILIIILACINLIHIPFGTALSIFTFWVLSSSGAEREFQRLHASQ